MMFLNVCSVHIVLNMVLMVVTDSGCLPVFIYAIFGSSRQLAVGPVALTSLLVSNVLTKIVSPSDKLYTELAITLSLMVGVLECLMGILR